MLEKELVSSVLWEESSAGLLTLFGTLNSFSYGLSFLLEKISFISLQTDISDSFYNIYFSSNIVGKAIWFKGF